MSRRVPFVRPVYQGARSGEEVLPLEALGDLAAWRDLLVALAAALYQNEHNQPPPAHFADALSLHLGHTLHGSALISLERVLPDGTAPAHDDVFDRARRLLDATMTAAADPNTPLPEAFPRPLYAHFDRLGRWLRDGESVVWLSGHWSKGPRYDQAARKRLVLETAQRYTLDIDRVGTLVGHAWPRHAAAGCLRVDFDGDEVSVAFSPVLADLARALLGSPHPRVRVVGTGRFDRDDRLLEVVGVRSLCHVAPDSPHDADRARIDADLALIATLQDGWHDGAGTAYARALLRSVRATLEALLALGVPAPLVLPTPEGDVYLEWTAPPPAEVSARIDARFTLLTLRGSPGLTDPTDTLTVHPTALPAVVAFLQAHGVPVPATEP